MCVPALLLSSTLRPQLELYEVPPTGPAEMHPEDKAIIDAANAALGVDSNTGKGRADPDFDTTWLMRTTHMSKYGREVGFGQAPQVSRKEHAMKVSDELQEVGTEEGRAKAMARQSGEIDASFEAAKRFDNVHDLAHPTQTHRTSNAPLKAAKVLPLYLDTLRSRFRFHLGEFEEAPGNDTGLSWCDEDVSNDIASTSAAMHLAQSSDGQPIIGYMLPKTVGGGADGAEEQEGNGGGAEEQEYEWIREYTFDVEDQQDMFGLLPSNEAVTYVPVASTIRMKQLRAREQDGEHFQTVPSRIRKRRHVEEPVAPSP